MAHHEHSIPTSGEPWRLYEADDAEGWRKAAGHLRRLADAAEAGRLDAIAFGWVSSASNEPADPSFAWDTPQGCLYIAGPPARRVSRRVVNRLREALATIERALERALAWPD